MQICISPQTDNHATQFLQAGCPSCCPANNVKALKAVPVPRVCKKHSDCYYTGHFNSGKCKATVWCLTICLFCVGANAPAERLGLDDIITVLQQNRLRWYGHVLRKEDNDWMKKCTEYKVDGARPRGTPKKTWREIVEKDCQVRRLNREDAVDHSR